ncbi:MAG: cupin domain-containing protein [Ardenticatenaceae bacterium]|nr:cupin domain-containing protein [Ardenticatenaceae bacterium]HBY98818.1 hypothetical protein [Chloroflexota bacterium]
MTAEQALVVTPPSQYRPRETPFPATTSELICAAHTPSESLYVGIIALNENGAKVPMHRHAIEEVQYILYGSGMVRDDDGNQYPVTPGTCVYSPAYVPHEFENTGTLPLGILFIFPSPGGVHPGFVE